MGFVSGQSRESGDAPPGGGGGGDLTEITSIDGSVVVTGGAGPVVDLSVTPASIGALASDGSIAMTGNLDMGTNSVFNASTVAMSGNMTSGSILTGAVTGTTFNGVALTNGGAATNFLNEAGAYVAIADEDDLTWSFSFNGNRAAGAPLNMAGGLPCDSAGRVGMKITRACTLTAVGWHRGDADVGEIAVEVYRAGAIHATATVAVPVSTPEGTGVISIAVLDNDLVAAFVSSGSSNTLTDPVIRVRGTLP